MKKSLCKMQSRVKLIAKQQKVFCNLVEEGVGEMARLGQSIEECHNISQSLAFISRYLFRLAEMQKIAMIHLTIESTMYFCQYDPILSICHTFQPAAYVHLSVCPFVIILLTPKKNGFIAANPVVQYAAVVVKQGVHEETR